MADDHIELLQQYHPIRGGAGREAFVPHAFARRRPRGMWEAWLLFLSVDSNRAVITARETTQPRREHVLYWAQGLGSIYLRGALDRALRGSAGARVVKVPPARRSLARRPRGSGPRPPERRPGGRDGLALSR